MKRVERQPSKLGAVDFADELGRELNLPLNRISEKFSFDEATKLAIENQRLMYGRRTEKMFEYVVASLGKAELITPEDATAPLYAGDEVQAPDYFVALKSGQRFFIEVKNACSKNLHAPVSFSKKYLARLKRYAHLKGHPLTIAVFWRTLGRWTINYVEDFETKNGTINLRFIDAQLRSIAGEFGDRHVGIVPPLVCRIHAHPDRPSSIDQEGIAHFIIGKLTFYTEGKEILNDLEKQLAFYLIFHSRWNELDPIAKMDGDRIEYIEFVSEPPERHEGQEFEIIGSTAGMVSAHFEWLTTAETSIIRLTPELTPAQMAPGFDDTYKGECLRLWQFHLQPNCELVRMRG